MSLWIKGGEMASKKNVQAFSGQITAKPLSFCRAFGGPPKAWEGGWGTDQFEFSCDVRLECNLIPRTT